MIVDIDELARALADRFQSIVPEKFHVWEHNGMLWYSAESTTPRKGSQTVDDLRENLGCEDPSEDGVAWCAEDALDALQVFVEEESAEPWPSAHAVRLAHARVTEGGLRLWFGDANAPVLECVPIDLSRIA